MFYIFNSKHVCISTGDSLPNIADLLSRGEYCLESNNECNVGYINKGGVFTPPQETPTTENVLVKRKKLLSYFDVELYRNPFYWETLSLEQKNERLAYRQALLDITIQPGYPSKVVWPEYPTL